MESVSTLIHIGFRKCASTSLQRNLFQNHPEVLHLGKPYEDEEIGRLADQIQFNDEVAFEPDLHRATLSEFLEDHNPDGKTLCLSDEGLTGQRLDRADVARRLREVFGRCRVLLVVRNQLDLLPSLYTEWLKAVGSKFTYKDFEGWLDWQWQLYQQGLIGEFRLLEFATIAEVYQDVFGADRVQVIPFEQLKTDPDSFAEDIADFGDFDATQAIRLMRREPQNSRPSAWKLRWYWIQDRLPFSDFGFLSGPIRDVLRTVLNLSGPVEFELPQNWQGRVHDLYRSSNKRLSTKHDLDLRSFGYPV